MWAPESSFDGPEDIRVLAMAFGFKEGVSVRACRARHRSDVFAAHTIFTEDDGTSVRVPLWKVEGSIRMRWRVFKQSVAFSWVIHETTPFYFYQLTDFGAWASTWNGGETSMILKFGQNFYRDNSDVWDQARHRWGSEHKLFRLVSVDEEKQLVCMLAITETVSGGVERSVYELPVSKFMQLYDPVKELTDREYRKYRIENYERVARGETPRAITRSPHLLPTFSLNTLWKIVRQWRKVKLLVMERMYAPGGVGAKRARDDFEHRLQEGKSEDALVGDILAD
jgi:hypothetical protein